MDILVSKENYDGMLIRSVLQSRLKYSSAMIKKLKFSENGITVNGEFVTVRYQLKAGDVLSLKVEDTDDDVSPYTIPYDIPIGIIYEDEYVTVVNKPADMPAHPSLGHRDDTVANALAFRYNSKPYVFRPVNRLDRDTSGCMLTANTKAACYQMYKAMTEGRIHKTYLAVLDGIPERREGRLESYMKRAQDSIIVRCETTADDPEGKEAVTEYRVLCDNGTKSVVMASPITGRTHQLRVQFASIGCPITGDTLYGNASGEISRHALHCIKTVFPHPFEDRMINAFAPLPEDMQRLMYAEFTEEVTESVIGLLSDNSHE